jgi:nucleoside-diphosphate-sugar epimerase
MSVLDLIGILESHGYTLRRKFIKGRPVDRIKRRCLDCSLAEKLFGWKSRVNIEEGILKTLSWMKSQRDTEKHS